MSEIVSSDTNIWLDFYYTEMLELPFMLPLTYIMDKDTVENEIISPPDLSNRLLQLGLKETELSIEEYMLAEYYASYERLSIYDRIALSIAKLRKIRLLTGDKALRKAAASEGVSVIGTISILDMLYDTRLLGQLQYKESISRLMALNGGKVRLPSRELQMRLDAL